MVLIDNGRSAMFEDGFDMLRCIRCDACINHCPVYNTVGGHAYNSMYEGPMGSVLTPGLRGLETAPDLLLDALQEMRNRLSDANPCPICCASGASARWISG